MQKKRFTLRINSDLFKIISELAGAHRRSVAKEIEQAIDEYVKREQDPK